MAAPSYINAVDDRELLLRGHRIPLIENLGVVGDQNDIIDCSDNDIRILGNFPRFPRLSGLVAARNRISHIQPSLSEALPNLRTLVLTANALAQLADLDPLAGFKKLEFLSLLDNPVTSRPNYRLYVIWRNPNLRIFDYQKVRESERSEARRLFGTFDKPTALASQIMGHKSKTFDILGTSGENGGREIVTKLTEDDKKRLENSLLNATSLEEMEKIERALKTGYI